MRAYKEPAQMRLTLIPYFSDRGFVDSVFIYRFQRIQRWSDRYIFRFKAAVERHRTIDATLCLIVIACYLTNFQLKSVTIETSLFGCKLFWLGKCDRLSMFKCFDGDLFGARRKCCKKVWCEFVCLQLLTRVFMFCMLYVLHVVKQNMQCSHLFFIFFLL